MDQPVTVQPPAGSWFLRQLGYKPATLPDGQPPRAVIFEELIRQINWYDRKSRTNQFWYRALKAVSIISAAAIPAVAAFDGSVGVSAVLGVVITICEGFQGVNQYHQNWLTYRSTCEALRREKFNFFAQSGPYADSQNGEGLLAQRVDGLVAAEHSKWVASQTSTKGGQTEQQPEADAGKS